MAKDKPKTTKAKKARKNYDAAKFAHQAEQAGKGKSIKDMEADKRKYKTRIPAGVLFDAVDTDKEEGRMRKINRKTSSTTFDPKTRKKRRGKTKAKMGGGKIYASMDKKYGGGIYPKMGK